MKIDTPAFGTHLLSIGFTETDTRRIVTQLQKGLRSWPNRLLTINELEFTNYAGDHVNFRVGNKYCWVNLTFAEFEVWFNYWHSDWEMGNPSDAARLPLDFDYRKIGDTIGRMATGSLVGFPKHILITYGVPR